MFKWIQILLLMVFVVLMLSGCAGLKADYDSYLLAKKDVSYMASLEKARNDVSAITATVANSVPVTRPFSNAIGWFAGAVLYLVASVYHGKAIKKK